MSNLNDSRRNFLKKMGGLGAGVLAGFGPGRKAFSSQPGEINYDFPLLQGSANYMGDFQAPKLETVRCAFIGVGSRG